MTQIDTTEHPFRPDFVEVPAVSGPTHAIIDGHIHQVISIEEASANLRVHSHRVKFACGLAFDVPTPDHFAMHSAEVSDHGAPATESLAVATARTAAAMAATVRDTIEVEWHAARDRLHAVNEKMRAEIEALDTPHRKSSRGTKLRYEAKVGEIKAKYADEIDAAEAALDEVHGRAEPLRMAHHEANVAVNKLRDQVAPRRWIHGAVDATTCPACKAPSLKE